MYVVNNITGVLTMPDHQLSSFWFLGGAFSVVSNHGINVGVLTAGVDWSNGNLGVPIMANAGQHSLGVSARLPKSLIFLRQPLRLKFSPSSQQLSFPPLLPLNFKFLFYSL